MRPPTALPRTLLLLACLAAALPCATQAPAEPAGKEAPANGEDAKADDSTAPPPADPSAPRPASADTNVSQLAGALPAEHRALEAGGKPFAVFVRTPGGTDPPRGAIVLIPGDGQLPLASEALGRLREQMPRFRWSTWVPELERPPRVRTIAVAAPVAPPPAAEGGKEGAASEDGKAEPPAPKPAPEPAQATPEQPAAEGQAPETATPAPEQVPTDTSLAEEYAAALKAWHEGSLQRLVAVVTAAAKDGPVVLVAEGAAAPLVRQFAAGSPASVFAAALLWPVDLPGDTAAWPEGFAAPVLEVLPLEDGPSAPGLQAKTDKAVTTEHYRLLRLPVDQEASFDGETVLVRRFRGWLLSQPHPQDAKPAGD